MEESRNWLEMPDEIMGGMILHRLGAVEMLIIAQNVCTTWRKICNDPAMWKVIDLHDCFATLGFMLVDCDTEKLTKLAVHRSCGELIDITLDFCCDNDLLDYISRCSSKLNHLRLMDCYDITGPGLNSALKRLPHLETVELSYIYIDAEDIEIIGRNCPQLKSFMMETDFMECDGYAHAIANSMPALRHLVLVGAITVKDDGIRAILNGCPHLESLDLSWCSFIHLDSNLEKVCRERIKDFKFKRDNNTEVHEESGRVVAVLDDINDFYDNNDGMEDYEDDYDGSWLY